MRRIITILVFFVLGTAIEGQDLHDWQSLAQLKSGQKVRLTLKSGPLVAAFVAWTPRDVTAGSVTTKREDVVKIERLAKSRRAKNAGIGALIGFGGGFAIGAAAGGCNRNSFAPCLSRGEVGAVTGAVGLVVGASVGALFHKHSEQVIYSVE